MMAAGNACGAGARRNLVSKCHPSRPCCKTDTYYTHFMNWSAEENLLTATVNMARQCLYLQSWTLNIETLAIIQNGRNWIRKGEQVLHILS